MNFTEFKDRIWRGYDWATRMLFRLPLPIARAGFSIIASVLWIGWVIPRNPVRRAFQALSRVSGQGSPIRTFSGYVRGFSLALFRFELLRMGKLEEIGSILRVPEKDRLEQMLADGGVMLMMPHAHGSLSMAEALGQKYPLTFVVRSAKDDGRASHQMQYYAKMNCDVIDVRRNDDMVVTRTIIRALRQGRIVLAAGDLVKNPPKTSFDERRGLVRVDAFGQPVGALAWPARFAKKAGVPIVPVMIEQSEDDLALHLGPQIESTDLLETSQAWMDGMLALVCQYPSDWTFVLDKRWVKLLENAGPEYTGNAPRNE